MASGKIKDVLKVLRRTYPDVRCALHHEDPFQLAVATILSAQCTDKRVNLVTPTLFKKYPTPKHFSRAPLRDIEAMIRSTGFYKNKAKAIQGLCRDLIAHHDGKIPQTLEALVKLPGIGRKTANVILGVGFGIPGIVVDTHVKRLTYRLGLTAQKDPTKIEFEMMEILPKKDWSDFGLLLIQHGRQICLARKPRCETCPINKVCPKIGV